MRNYCCQNYAPYPSMGFVPLQGSQPAVASVSLTDQLSTLRRQSTVRALDDIQNHPPPVQDNPFCTFKQRCEAKLTHGFEPSEPRDGDKSLPRRVPKSVRLAVLRRLLTYIKSSYRSNKKRLE